ncbi:MAG: hypothetical protein JNJ85_16995 [Candidatus Kapabacteria bacterium]|nr:hypothetical protein [Candidatus Kapabacteria bacterium]
MKTFSYVVLLSVVILTPSLYSQSRTTPELRPNITGKRLFISIDVLPTIFNVGTGLTYNAAFSPKLYARLTVVFPYKQINRRIRNSTPNSNDIVNELFNVGTGFGVNLGDSDLEGTYLGCNFDFMAKETWERKTLSGVTKETRELYLGLFLTPTYGYRYFWKFIGVGVELGPQISLTSSFDGNSNIFFYAGRPVDISLRVNVGMGF